MCRKPPGWLLLPEALISTWLLPPIAFGFAYRVVLRIRRREFRFNFRQPFVEKPPQFRGPRGLRFGQIVLLADIGGEVVQLHMVVLVETDQLPSAEADRAGRPAQLVAVMRVMPEQRARGKAVLRFQQARVTDAIQSSAHGCGQAGQLRKGREMIDARKRRVVHRALANARTLDD